MADRRHLDRVGPQGPVTDALEVRCTDDGEVIVPARIAGPLAALIRKAMPMVAADWGSQLPWHRQLRSLEQPLAESARRHALPSSARPKGVVRHAGGAMVTTAVAHERTGLPSRTLTHWCNQGEVPGAAQVGRSWLIPESWVTARSIDEESA